MADLAIIKQDILQGIISRVGQNDPVFTAPMKALLTRSNAALTIKPPSVMDKKRTPPSGDKHDFMSLATYWYPNPNTPDGTPWIRRDGETNPLVVSDEFDRIALERMTHSASDLTLAYAMTGNAAYAEKAATLLRTWFLDPATRMNPHLEYSQAIPGMNNGRCIGIIDTHTWVELLDFVELLRGSSAWPQADHQALQQWFARYNDWLINSALGKEEESQTNNHGTWYDTQVARFALFSGRHDIAKTIIEKARDQRFTVQIEPDGRMPLELARTRSFSYTAFNLRAWFYLARMGEKFSIDLWHHSTTDGRSLQKSLQFAAPYMDPSVQWPYQQIGEANFRTSFLPALRMGYVKYQDPRYVELLKRASDFTGPDADHSFLTILPQ